MSKEQRQRDRDQAPASDFDTREGMMSSEQCAALGAERGMEDVANFRCDQSGSPGPQADGAAVRRPDLEGGERAQLLEKKAEERDSAGDEEREPVKPQEWKKYDWVDNEGDPDDSRR